MPLKRVYAAYLGSTGYIGYTVNPHRRQRQHQGELKGGARSTRGKNLTIICVVWPFKTERQALSFERSWKLVRLWGKRSKARKLVGRTEALEQLLCREKWGKAGADPKEIKLQVSWIGTNGEDPRDDWVSKWSYSRKYYADHYSVKKVKHTFDIESVKDLVQIMYPNGFVNS
jgi:predicted GIY-YIG superfamily endonuclease